MGRKRNKNGAKEKDGGNDVNAAAEVAMAKAVRRVQEILWEHSEEEIRAALLQCNLNHNVVIDRLLSLQDASNEQGASTQLPDSSTTTSSILVPDQSAITNGETRSVPISSGEADPSFSVPSSSDVTNGETRSVPISSSEAVPPLSVPSSSASETRSVPISSCEAVPSLSVPSSSAITNGESRSVPISSNVAVPPLSVPSSRALTNVKPKRQESRMVSASDPPMAEVLRGLHVPSKQNATKAPVKADSPLKPDATNNPLFFSFFVNQPMDTRQQSIATTASSLGPRPPTSMSTDAFGTYPISESHINQQAMNHYNSLGQVRLEQYGNVMNSPYLWRPEQNEKSNVLSSAPFQQRGGGSNSNTLAHHGNMMSSHYTWLGQDDTSIYQSLDSPYRNSTLPVSATSSVPTYHDSAYGVGMFSDNSRLGYEDVSRNHLPSNSSGGTSTAYSRPWSESIPRVHLPSNSSGISRVPSSHGSDYGRGMSSGNGSNSRLGYGNVSRNHLPSNSSGTSSIGPSSHVNGSNSRLGYGDYLPPVHHQGRIPSEWRVQGEDSYRSIPFHSRQNRDAYFERNRAYLASLDQGYNRNDPSDQTKQRPRDNK